MIRCFLGDEVFFGGLNTYLKEFEYGNPTTEDLMRNWDAFIADNSIEVKIFKNEQLRYH